MTTDIVDDLEERVNKFQMLELPGQPQGMHMGTSYLVSDLWREVRRLRSAAPAVTEEILEAAKRVSDNYRPKERAWAAYGAVTSMPAEVAFARALLALSGGK